MTTPARAYGHPDFVTDVPVQGPTDEGIRAADCWWTQNVLPQPRSAGGKGPACVDCHGPVPMWANNPTAWNGGPPEYGGNGGPNCFGERLQHNGRYVAGFALDAAGDPAATLTGDQQGWVFSALAMLNRQITATTGTNCSSWQEPGANLAAAVGCFQSWANANGKGPVRSDGVLDEDTLCALIATTVAHAADFQTPFPDPSGQRCYGGAAPSAPSTPSPAPATPAVPATPAAPVASKAAAILEPPPVAAPGEKGLREKLSGLSLHEKIALGIASAVVVGGAVYTATRKKR